MNVRLGLVTAISLAVLAGACGDGGAAPPPPRDSGSGDDGGMDGGSPDGGGMDAGDMDGMVPPSDGGMDGFVIVQPDGTLPLPDGFLPGDALPDPEEDSGVGQSCTPGACPAGAICLGDGAGGSTCQPSGHPCGGATDCPAGSTCLASGVCDRGSPLACADSRDCPLGYACEAQTCVDRRITCDMDTALCPYGFYCFFPAYTAAGFCQKNTNPCGSDAGCLPFWECVDATGAGVTQCMPASGCNANAECSGGTPVCEVSRRGNAGCGDRGPCADAADCDTGLECVDLWGDGLKECVPTGGTCGSAADCTAPQVCGSDSAGAAPSCIGSGRDF